MVATESNSASPAQVGGALRRRRLERRLGMKQVAARAGVTRPMLSRYELGRQQPSLSNLVKVLRALDCSEGPRREKGDLLTQVEVGDPRGFRLRTVRSVRRCFERRTAMPLLDGDDWGTAGPLIVSHESSLRSTFP